MLFSALASAILTLSSFTIASPVQPRQTSQSNRFFLQTQVIPGINDCGTNKNGLFVFSYHTGAGLGAAAAEPQSDTDDWFFLNETDTGLYFSYTNNTIGPWPTTLEYGPYQGMLLFQALF